MTQAKPSFTARGGMWVLAQVPLMLLALVIPMRFGAGHFMPVEPMQMVGVAAAVLGGAIILWGFVSLGDALSPYPKPLAGATLHRQGAFKWMRHPIYAGVLLASFGWALWWLSWPSGLYAMALAVFFDRKAAREELWLRQQYKEYPDYQAKVKKFIPGVY